MLTLHHLEWSRSVRVLWFLEEVGIEHELIQYKRNAQYRSPDELKAVHPLGTSPVLVDGDLVLTESSAILRYLDAKYAGGHYCPPPGTDAHARHDQWLDYAEGSAAENIQLSFVAPLLGGLPAPLKAYVDAEVDKALGYIAAGIGDGPYLLGPQLTLADFQMSFTLAAARRLPRFAAHAALGAYLDRLHQQPALIRAIERGGPMTRPSKKG